MPAGTAAGITNLPGGGVIDQNPLADPITSGLICGGGTLSDNQIICQYVPAGIAASNTPAPPPPPTHAEIVATTCPPTPPAQIGHNPQRYGITGLDTWLWSKGTHHTSTTGTIRGYPVACTLQATTFHYDTGDTTAHRYNHPRTYTTTTPGHQGPTTPTQHLYETTGTYTLTLTITWTRTTTAGTDTTTNRTTTTYPVKEIRIHPTTPPR